MAPEEYIRVVFGLVAVLGLIGLLAAIARKTGFAAFAKSGGGKRRLSVVETLPLDARRKLAIVRCDGREHLLVLGAQGETVVESSAARLEDDAPIARNPFAELREAVSAAARKDGAEAA